MLLTFSVTLAAKNKSNCSCEKIPKRFSLAQAGKSQFVFAENDMVKIPAGSFMMGGDDKEAKADEFPKHKVLVNGFLMDKTPVTNAQFEKFVQDTNYVTTAEIKPDWDLLKKPIAPRYPKTG